MSHEKTTPIGLQLPRKARQFGGRNFTSLQGEVRSDESPIEALFREASEEYNLSRPDIRQVEYLISTLVPVSPDSSKAKDWDAQWLHWFGLRTRRNFRPNDEHVAQFAWCSGPNEVFDVLSESRIEKLMAFSAAMASALASGWLPAGYKPVAELLAYNVDKAA